MVFAIGNAGQEERRTSRAHRAQAPGYDVSLARPPAFGTRLVHEPALDLHWLSAGLVAGGSAAFPIRGPASSQSPQEGAGPAGWLCRGPRCHSDPGRALDAKALVSGSDRSWRLRAATPLLFAWDSRSRLRPAGERR